MTPRSFLVSPVCACDSYGMLTRRQRRLYETVINRSRDSDRPPGLGRRGLMALALLSAASAFGSTGLEIITLSNWPLKLSGGDVLVKIVVPAGTPLREVKVRLNRHDVTISSGRIRRPTP